MAGLSRSSTKAGDPIEQHWLDYFGAAGGPATRFFGLDPRYPYSFKRFEPRRIGAFLAGSAFIASPSSISSAS